MRRILFATALTVWLGGFALGQVQPEPGEVVELRGLSNVFVGPSVDSALNRKISSTVQEKIPHLTFVSKVTDADVWLSLTFHRQHRSIPVPPNPNDHPGATRGESPELTFVAHGQVFVVKRSQSLRLIKKFQREGYDQKALAKRFAEDFVRIYREANVGAPTPTVVNRGVPLDGRLPPSLKRIDKPTKPAAARSDDIDVLRVDTDLVTINVSVLDGDNKYVSTLKKEAFSLKEEGVKQELSYFATVDESFTVALLIDTSRSVKSKLSEIIAAAHKFIDQLRPADRLMVVTFSTDIDEIVQPTDIQTVKSQGFAVVPGVGANTYLYDAIDFVLNQRLNMIAGRKAVILLTDGVGDERLAGFKSNLRDVEESGAMVYAIQFDSFEDATKQFTGPNADRMVSAYKLVWERATDQLQQLSQKSGGRFYHADEIGDFSDAFASIVNDLRNMYSLGYYPRPLPKPGERRDVKVSVAVPKLVVRGRKRYVFSPR